MPINLNDFRTRATQGESRIRLSGSKTSSSGEATLATHKGTLAGRVVEWHRGNALSQIAENKAVTHVFLDAIQTEFGDVGAKAVRQQLAVNDGKPLKSSQVSQLIQTAENAVANANARNQAIDQAATEITASVFSEDQVFNAFSLTRCFFEQVGASELGQQMTESLQDPNSDASTAVARAIHDVLSRNWPNASGDLSAERKGELTNLVRATVIRTLLKEKCGSLALQSDACVAALLRQPSVQVRAGSAIYEVNTLDVLTSALTSSRADPTQLNSLVQELVDTAASLAGWGRPSEGETGVCARPAGLERANKLLKLGFDHCTSLATAGTQRHPVTSKALALHRDLQIATATVNDGSGNSVTNADAIEVAIDIECARLALHPDEDDFRVLDSIQDQVCRTRGCTGNLDGTAQTNRQFLQALRAKAGTIQEGTGLDQQSFISSGMRQLTSQMIRQAIAAVGPAPVDLGTDFKFEAISLGSTSRAEASLYSDVELAFVLPQNLSDEQVATAREYLQKVSILIRLQVKAQGESGELGLPQKVHWDEAWNTPAESPEAFIGRPSDLVASSFGIANGRPIEANYFTMFANAEWLYSSNEKRKEEGPAALGSTDLTDALHAQSRANFSQSSAKGQPSNGRTLGTWLLKEGLAIQSGTDGDFRPSTLRKLVGAHQTAGLSINVKKLSRLPMMLAQGLCLVNDIHQEIDGSREPPGAYLHSTHMRTEALVRTGILDRQQGDNLVRAMDLLGKVRLASHLANDRAEDSVALEGNDDLIEAIRLLAPLEVALTEALADKELSFPNPSKPVSSEPYTF